MNPDVLMIFVGVLAMWSLVSVPIGLAIADLIRRRNRR